MSTFVRQTGLRRAGFALALMALVVSGCVERRMTIRSNPPGAMVYIDDYEIGTTPVATSYIYYGTRKIRLVKDGYETLTVYQPIPPPWYQWCGIDFFSENIWPGEIRDERAFNYQMSPMVSVPTDQLLGRAEQLRSANRSLPTLAPEPLLGPVPAGPTGPAIAPPPSGAIPSYAPPGGPLPGGMAPAELPAPGIQPSNVPGGSPGFPSSVPPYLPATPPAGSYPPPGGYPSGPATTPSPSQGVLPPDWRPISQGPTGVQR